MSEVIPLEGTIIMFTPRSYRHTVQQFIDTVAYNLEEQQSIVIFSKFTRVECLRVGRVLCRIVTREKTTQVS